MRHRRLHLCALFRRHIWDGRVLEDTAVEKVHDVKVGSDNGFVLTKT